MKQYLDLLKEVYDFGVVRKQSRAGMESTKQLFHRSMEFDLTEGFPIQTTKRVSYHNVIREFLWMLKGRVTIQDLIKDKVNIWNDDAFKFYNRKVAAGQTPLPQLEKEEWLSRAKEDERYCHIGMTYGRQWRNFGGMDIEEPLTGAKFFKIGCDQITTLFQNLKNRPESRYHIVSAWNPTEISDLQVALPPCHILFSVDVDPIKGVSLSIIQRSADMVLGVPYNIAFYATMAHLIAYYLDKPVNKLYWTGFYVHIYESHMKAAKEILSRTPHKLPRLDLLPPHPSQYERKEDDGTILLNPKWFEDITPGDFKLIGYEYDEPVKAPLIVGI